jgi:hypothetical protein
VFWGGRSDTKETWDVPAFHTLFYEGSKENGNMEMTKPQKTTALEGLNVKTIVDPTGCGNTFCGGFLAGWYKTRNVLTAALWGSVSASFSKPLHLLSLNACHMHTVRLYVSYVLQHKQKWDHSRFMSAIWVLT